MLLTLKPSQQHGYANPYAYSPAQRSPSSYYSSPPKTASLPPLPDNQPQRMTTPHRGLPPPSVMERSLPLPERAQPSSSLSLNTSMGPLPAQPTQRQGQEEPTRSWFDAKKEEDRRKQEEEKTRQEDLKLQQRKVEQNMLQESLRGGVPPPMVPLIFASIGGGNVANMSVEWAQHYMTQMSLQQQVQIQQQQQQQQQQQAQQQQQQQQQLPAPSQVQPSPEQRREPRMIAGPNPNPYGAQQMQPPAQTTSLQPMQQNQPAAAYTPSYSNATLPSDRVRAPQPLQAAPPTSNPRPTTSQSSLSRLNTGDMHPAPAGNSSLPLAMQQPIQQAQSTQGQDQPTSPGLYFHHWQPPDSQGKSKDKDSQGTPAAKSTHTSPNTQPPGSHLRSDHTTSPKKRKATGSHQAAPTPSQHTSPSFSHQASSGSTSGRRRRHSRASDTSSHSQTRAAHESGRQSFSEAESGRNSAHPETRHSHQHHPAGSDSRERREIRRVSGELSERSSPNRES